MFSHLLSFTTILYGYYPFVYLKSNQILFVKPEITIYKSSHWALTACTVVTSSALRPSDRVRKNSKTLNRENKKPQEEPQRWDPSS